MSDPRPPRPVPAPPPEAVIFSGLQATGKSTFYRERFFHEGMRLEIGACFADYGPPEFYRNATETFRGHLYDALKALLTE